MVVGSKRAAAVAVGDDVDRAVGVDRQHAGGAGDRAAGDEAGLEAEDVDRVAVRAVVEPAGAGDGDLVGIGELVARQQHELIGIGPADVVADRRGDGTDSVAGGLVQLQRALPDDQAAARERVRGRAAEFQRAWRRACSSPDCLSRRRRPSSASWPAATSMALRLMPWSGDQVAVPGARADNAQAHRGQVGLADAGDIELLGRNVDAVQLERAAVADDDVARRRAEGGVAAGPQRAAGRRAWRR